MKKLNLLAVPLCFLLLLTITGTFSCKKSSNDNSTIPFQGPQNPSFEANADWVSQAGTVNQGFFDYDTGTGFLPSQGSYYASLTNWVDNANQRLPSVYFYQDGVDFSHSTTMTFDYMLSAISPTFANTPPVSVPVTVQILFTANGTVTLWQTTVNTNVNGVTAVAQALNTTISLPSLPSPGRLVIELIASTGNQGIFGIDNIRVH